MSDFRGRVVIESAAVVLALALAAAWLGGAPAALGVAAGGALALGNFWRLVSDAASACAPSAPVPQLRWLVGSGMRLIVFLGLAGVLLASGWAHPVALVLGLSVLPFDLVVQGLRVARRDTGV